MGKNACGGDRENLPLREMIMRYPKRHASYFQLEAVLSTHTIFALPIRFSQLLGKLPPGEKTWRYLKKRYFSFPTGINSLNPYYFRFAHTISATTGKFVSWGKDYEVPKKGNAFYFQKGVILVTHTIFALPIRFPRLPETLPSREMTMEYQERTCF